MKKTIALVLLLTIAFSSIIAVANENSVLITINGIAIEFPDAQPFVDDSHRSQLPIRAVAEFLGITVTWDETTQTANLLQMNNDQATGDYMRFTIGKNEIEIGKFNATTDIVYFPKSTIEMDTIAISKNNRIFIPIRFVAESLNYNVEWDETATSVNLRKEEFNLSKKMYGKLDADLFKKLDTLGNEERIDVGIWLNYSENTNFVNEVQEHFASIPFDGDSPITDDVSLIDSIQRYSNEKLAKDMTERKRPLIDKLNNKNIPIIYSSIYAPNIYISVTKEELMLIQEFPEVVSIAEMGTGNAPAI